MFLPPLVTACESDAPDFDDGVDEVGVCQSEGAGKMLADLPAALDCGEIDDHPHHESDWAYVECVFGAFDVDSIDDAVQKAGAVGLDLGLPEQPVEEDLIAAAADIRDAILALACQCGATPYCGNA